MSEVEYRVAGVVPSAAIPALGGEDLSTLYFTSGSLPIPADERAAHRGAGGLFALEAPAQGFPEPLFRSSQQASPS